MFEKTHVIKLSGEEYPIKCDHVVLEEIQEKYNDLMAFEKLIYRFTPDLNEKGEPKRNKDGLMTGSISMPDIRALDDALVWMVDEGQEIENKPPIERKELLRAIDIPPMELSKAVHDEYLECFASKN